MALAVMLGAFGAHGLEGKISDRYLDTYKTANFYHFIHGLAILALPSLQGSLTSRQLKFAFYTLLAGIALFSGSLYLLSLWEIFQMPQLKILGAITPIGGLSFIMGWLYLAFCYMKSNRSATA